MRGRNDKRTSDWRSQKRALLRALLFAAAPMVTVSLVADLATAETPIAKSSLVLPPLPLTGQAQTKGLQPNPFCQPSPLQIKNNSASDSVARPSLGMPQPVQNRFFELSLPGIQLASGTDAPFVMVDNATTTDAETTVRLLPLATASSEAATSGLVRPNPMVINEPSQAPTSGAILLPIVPQSEKVANHPEPATVVPPLVVSPAVVAAPTIAQPTEAAVQPTVVAASPVVEPVTEQAVVAPVTGTEPLDQPVAAKPARTKAKPWKPQALETQALEPQATEDTAAESEAFEGAVSFSLNDTKLVETSNIESTPVAETVTKVAPKSGATIADIMRNRNQKQSRTAAPVSGTVVLGKATSQARRVDSTVTIARGASKTLLVPLDPVDDPKSMSPSASPDKRIVKGSRPRVDVGVPTVAIERTSHDMGLASIGPVAIDASQISGKEAAFQSDAPVMVDLKSTEVRALKFDSSIRRVQIGDSSICAAVAAGPSQIQLIGVRDGVTRLAIWTATASGQEQKTVYEIFVGATSRNAATEGSAIANTLTRSAKAAFPTSNIQVRHEQGEMIVEGTCADNDSAKQALRMIRSACKLPVVDKLTIR
jgi:hypothetical protein